MEESETAAGSERRTAPRVKVRTEIRIFYPDLHRLAAEICRDISVGGMFVESSAPPAVGTEIRFELHVPAKQPRVVRGEGEVMWSRAPGRQPDRAGGFGVKFVQLDAKFRELIFRIVDGFIQHGGEPFDLESEG